MNSILLVRETNPCISDVVQDVLIHMHYHVIIAEGIDRMFMALAAQTTKQFHVLFRH